MGFCPFPVPKYVITNLKVNNFKGKNQQEKLNAIFLSQINLYEAVSTKINTFRNYKGGLGASPPEAEENFKKSYKMETFPYFFSFWQGSLNPQNYELAP